MQVCACDVCGFEYNPAKGYADKGIEPNTAFEDLPEDFICPICGVPKASFSPVTD